MFIHRIMRDIYPRKAIYLLDEESKCLLLDAVINEYRKLEAEGSIPSNAKTKLLESSLNESKADFEMIYIEWEEAQNSITNNKKKPIAFTLGNWTLLWKIFEIYSYRGYRKDPKLPNRTRSEIAATVLRHTGVNYWLGKKKPVGEIFDDTPTVFRLKLILAGKLAIFNYFEI